MRFIVRHIQQIIGSYSGHPPLHHFLKNYYKNNRKLGSRDRRAISEAVYLYFRFKPFFDPSLPLLQIIQAGLKCSNTDNPFLGKIIEKNLDNNPVNIPPDIDKGRKNITLSKKLSETEWLKSQWQQPDLFIRIIRNKNEHLAFLKTKKIPFRLLAKNISSENTGILALPNATKINRLLPPQDYIVQDLSTQEAIFKASALRGKGKNSLNVWDACAGAGGKAILWKELFPQDNIWATDIRKSILNNFKKRFNLYGLNYRQTSVMDLSDFSKPPKGFPEAGFDYILCDVPCSGSGTWIRRPEEFYFFEENRLSEFSALQLTIAKNSVSLLKKGGILFYITCSVFKEENEAVVNRLIHETGLSLSFDNIINNYSQKADSIYIAALKAQ